MVRGCPVVSYDVPYGPREQIDDGGNGFLVPDGDYQAAARAVVRLLRSPALVEQLGSSARSWAARHDRTQFIADWARVLGGVVERSTSPAADTPHPQHAEQRRHVVIRRQQKVRPAPLTHQRTRAASTLRQHIASWRSHR